MRRNVWSADDHQFFFKKNLGSVGELSTVCCPIVLKCLYLARIGRPDILWSVNKLARAVTKWTKACNKRLARLISYIHHSREFKKCCHVGNTAQQCRLGVCQDTDFAGDLEDSKSTSCGLLRIFGSHTFVPVYLNNVVTCHVGHTAQQCRLGLFQDSDFAGDLEDSKSTSGGILCILRSHTVQESNISFTRFKEIRNYFSCCRSTHGWNSRS